MTEKRIRFIKHQEQLIMLIDVSHCTPAEIMPLADEIQRRVAEHPHHSLLTLADFTGVQIDAAAAMRIKEVLALDRPYVKKSAWVGTESFVLPSNWSLTASTMWCGMKGSPSYLRMCPWASKPVSLLR